MEMFECGNNYHFWKNDGLRKCHIINNGSLNIHQSSSEVK